MWEAWGWRGVAVDQEPGLVRGGGCKMDQESGLVDWRERRVEIDQEPGLVRGGGCKMDQESGFCLLYTSDAADES